MPMRGRPAARRDVHINYAEASIGLFAGHGDGVGIANQTDVREVVGLRQREIAFWIVRAGSLVTSQLTFRSPDGPFGLFHAALRFANAGGFFGKFFVSTRRMPQQLRQGLDVSGLRDEATFEIPLKHHADVERRPRWQPAFSSAPRTHPCRPRNSESLCPAARSKWMPSWDHSAPPDR